ncbi:hypothetical protein EV186_101754 [Labedaea rhizosphaerae]|uniref:Uncharacterized protein n=1 Tax=Labedaea rhizosphaerae TaxID=598644 RepID=A0A4R6SKA3_LABRH|nr:hypothetical protein EV186_101754 [Labedaea rhizosphaerae]
MNLSSLKFAFGIFKWLRKKAPEVPYFDTLLKRVVDKLPPDPNLRPKKGELVRLRALFAQPRIWTLLIQPDMRVVAELKDEVLVCLDPRRHSLNPRLAEEIATLAVAEFPGILPAAEQAKIMAEMQRRAFEASDAARERDKVELIELISGGAVKIDATRASGVDQYRKQLTMRLRQLQPQYEFQIKYHVVEGGQENIALSHLLDDNRWLAVCSKAGAGKSALVVREAMSLLARQDNVVVFLNLKTWKHKSAAADSYSSIAIDDILESSIVPVNEDSLAKVVQGSNQQPLWQIWFLDGVNELPSELSGHVLSVVTQHLRSSIASSLCITDRSEARYVDSNWTKVLLQDLEWAEVQKHAAGSLENAAEARYELLRTPFFLEIAVTAGKWEWRNSTEAIRSLFKNRLGLEESELTQLAEFALSVYQTQRSLNFDVSALAEKTGRELARKLAESGLLIPAQEGAASFYHQLLHDYLCSRAVYNRPDSWVPSTFDSLSFDANTYEAIFMVVDQIESESMMTAYLTALYNWNWFATIRCVDRAIRDGLEISDELLVTLSAMLAEKRFDRVHGSRTRAVEWTSKLDELRGYNFSGSVGIKGVVEEVERVAPKARSPWFNTWVTLFTKIGSSDQPLFENDIFLLDDANPFIGWTASQVIRWSSMDEKDLALVRSAYRGARHGLDDISRSVRWRAVHALGCHPSTDSSDLLLFAIDHDDYPWVVYGAVRSLLEMAALSSSDRASSILAEVGARLEQLPPEALGQVALVTRYDRDQEGWKEHWAAQVWPLLERAHQLQTDEINRERWKGRLEAFRDWVDQGQINARI